MKHTPPPAPTYTRADGARMVEVPPNSGRYRNAEFLHLQAKVRNEGQPTGQSFTHEDGAPAVQPRGDAEAWVMRHYPEPEIEQIYRNAANRVTWGEPRCFERPLEPALFVPADIETRRKWINVPEGRPLTVEEKRRDLMALISCGRAILDPPPRLGATEPSPRRQADADGIRAQPPLNTRPDKLAAKAARTANVEHITEHGISPSRLWRNTRQWIVGTLDAPAPGETEMRNAVRSMFDWQRPDARIQRHPVITRARPRRPYAYGVLSESWSPFTQKSLFWSSDKSPEPLCGTHSDPQRELKAWARSCQLSRGAERHLWALHLAGDQDARERLINSCASNCLAFAQKRLDKHERWDGFRVLLEAVGRIVDKREFDPEKGSLPGFVDKPLVWSTKDIKRRIRKRDRLMVQTDFTGKIDFDSGTGEIMDVHRGIAESAVEAEDGDEAEAEIAMETERLQAIVAALDESDQLMAHLTIAGLTQAETAAEMKVSQSTISRRLERLKNS